MSFPQSISKESGKLRENRKKPKILLTTRVNIYFTQLFNITI